MATLSYRKVNRVFPGGQHAVRDLDLEVADGEFVVLVGPSGCGKTTALRMTAGLEDITSGEIAIDGAVVNDVEPQRRDVAMVFQEYALYPQMTVFDNIAFSLKLRKLSRGEITQRVTGMAQTLGIEELLARKPRALSGGQRQRVAMGRALVRDPKVFLMDEPLSNLDAKLRVQMRHEVARIQRDLGTTTVYVTHDQIEAMTMGHRVAVMLDGVLQQVDTPQELYDRPGNMFVAAFIGSPEMNLIRAGLERNDEGDPRFVCHVGDQVLPLPVSAARDPAALETFAGSDIVLGLRPEVFEDAALAAAPVRSHVLRGDTTAVEILGAERLVQIAVRDVAVVTGDLLESRLEDEAGEPGEGSPRPDSVVVARLAPQSAAVVGSPIDVVVDMAQAHLFDPETQLPI